MRTDRDAYLDLLKKCLTAYLYPESSYRRVDALPGWAPIVVAKGLIVRSLGRLGYKLFRVESFDPVARENGTDWPSFGYSMIGLRRLDNLQLCVERVLEDHVPGDLIETGAWRGGACILMRAILASRSVSDRTVWVADSFQGLPAASCEPDRQLAREKPNFDLAGRPYLAASLPEVQKNFRRFGMLDGQVRFLEGWFKDTLPTAPIDQIAVLRLDGDLYESTMDALTSLYRKVSSGGFVIVDDYHAWPTCRRAVEEFRAKFAIDDPIEEIDGVGVFWRKTQDI
jgi:O-methyltransferase